MAVGPVADVRLAALLREFGDRVFEAVSEKGGDLPVSLRPGSRVQGEIVGQLGGGRSLIDVEGMLLQRAPAGERCGFGDDETAARGIAGRTVARFRPGSTVLRHRHRVSEGGGEHAGGGTAVVRESRGAKR